MKALNLYILSREIDANIFALYEKALSNRDETLKIRFEEINAISFLVNNFLFHKVDNYLYDNWFYSFKIKQIGKEFDLLKIGLDKKIMNIELKSAMVSEEKIKHQLELNRYYLSNIGTEIYSFTCVINNNSLVIYKLYNNKLIESSIAELIHYASIITEAIDTNIDDLFKPSDYLISPLNTPEKFFQGKYFLTNSQEAIKKKILTDDFLSVQLWGIKGSAGTGKTLLLYDIAKSLATKEKVGIIHCGILNDGHKKLNELLTNISIIDAKSLTAEWISSNQIICVDETHRLYKPLLDKVLHSVESGITRGCIFSYDFSQSLSKDELYRNNPGRLNAIDGFIEEKLSEKIRTNKEINSFIRNMLDLTDVPQEKIQYNNIDILYANDINESDKIIRFYRKKGYAFITYTPSQFYSNSIDHYSCYINSHQVIGQEFDSVVLVLDNNFRYSEEGKLQAKIHPNPNYIFERLFYQNISRTREKLCLIIIENPQLFEKLLVLKEK